MTALFPMRLGVLIAVAAIASAAPAEAAFQLRVSGLTGTAAQLNGTYADNSVEDADPNVGALDIQIGSNATNRFTINLQANLITDPTKYTINVTNLSLNNGGNEATFNQTGFVIAIEDTAAFTGSPPVLGGYLSGAATASSSASQPSRNGAAQATLRLGATAPIVLFSTAFAFNSATPQKGTGTSSAFRQISTPASLGIEFTSSTAFGTQLNYSTPEEFGLVFNAPAPAALVMVATGLPVVGFGLRRRLAKA